MNQTAAFIVQNKQYIKRIMILVIIGMIFVAIRFLVAGVIGKPDDVFVYWFSWLIAAPITGFVLIFLTLVISFIVTGWDIV